MEVDKRLLPPEKRKQKPTDENALGFGHLFTDHMLLINYNHAKGWHNARIEPYGPIVLDPAALALHYGQQTFEGLKAYVGADGEVCTFRPDINFARMLRSCQRLCIPDFPVKDFLDATLELIRIEKDCIPKQEGTSLYIRPNIIAIDPFIGVKPGSEYLFYVIVGPVGAYYPEGFNPVKIYVEEKYTRAAVGGLGEAKTGANYAASLLAAEESKKRGYTQVLWLDVRDRKSIEEVGTMNIFFVVGDEIVTPPLDGSILPGITRDSVIKLCNLWGLKMHERKITIDEVIVDHGNGTLKEIFGTGTAAVISPVGELAYEGVTYTIGNGSTGPLALKLYEELTGIQLGKFKDPFDWVVKVG